MFKSCFRVIWSVSASSMASWVFLAGCPVVYAASQQDSAPYQVPERPSPFLAPSDVSLNARARVAAPVPTAAAPTAAPVSGAAVPDMPPPSAPASDVMQAPAAPVQGGVVAPAVAPVFAGSAQAPAVGLPEPAPASPEIIRVLSLRQLGLTAPMTLRGFSPLQGLDIPIPADEIVTRAQIVLDGAMSPSLLPEASSLTVTLNEQYVGTVLVDLKNSRFGPLVFDIDPIFFTRLNHLNFQFSGEYRRDCNDMHNGVLWARVSDLSKVIIATVKLPPVRKLSHLPEPFFDPNLREVLKIPFVLPYASGLHDLKAAGIVASWFGKLADFRGASFPVAATFPKMGNAVEVGENIPLDSNGTLPSGPTLFEVANPNDPNGTVLVVTGQNQKDVETAARVLAFSTDTLGDVPFRVVSDVTLAPRKPYDAPAFVPTDRAVRFGELMSAMDLQHQGGAPLGIYVPFRIPPDLYRWKQHAFPVKLRARTPVAAAFEHEGARLDVLVNNAYVQSFPLFSDVFWKKAEAHLPGYQGGMMTFDAALPPWLLFGGRNQLDLNFNVLPIDRGACRRTNDDFIAEVDSTSTLDFSNSYHYATLPDLSYFAGSAFPFSRMADYSQTAVVLPAQPDSGTSTAFLNLMGFLGAATQYPAVGIDVVSSADLAGLGAAKDIIVLSTLDQLGAAKTLLSRSAYEINGQTIHVGQKTLLDGLWYLFQDRDNGGQHNNVQSVLNAPIVNASLLIGGESPYTNHRSVVAILGDRPEQLQQMVASLLDSQKLPAVQGDLVIKNGDVLTNYRNSYLYTVGSLPLWIRIELLLEAHVLLVILASLLGAGLLAVGTAKWLRSHARRRLQRQLQGEDEPIDS
ncbi:cellulose biosynthesis cyclic di-GMP-binding regulatory protein BcsB [Acetobacter okinawensis]|uniref:cellulose biosynthesis cyclic di-GMP-binding regulatory protein BcsB n=1 Tax=Acetobacter okinawensis TaxID=1076594 RepID=UPI001BAB9805|nr:cellulose biosynthesis cyclic di-GMP-binding regulatory protein BcsB [Acetobacter okinawensis]